MIPYEYLLFPNFVLLGYIQDENNIYTSFMRSKEPQVVINYLHQLLMHSNTILYELTSLIYLHLPNKKKIVYLYDYTMY